MITLRALAAGFAAIAAGALVFVLSVALRPDARAAVAMLAALVLGASWLHRALRP